MKSKQMQRRSTEIAVTHLYPHAAEKRLALQICFASREVCLDPQFSLSGSKGETIEPDDMNTSPCWNRERARH